MPSSYIIDPQQKLVVVVASGVVTARLYRTHIEIMRRDSRFDASFSLLFDARGTTDVRVSHVEMLELTAKPLFDSQARRAIVANEGLVFGMARMYELSFSDSASRRVFDRIESAEAWLEVNYAQSLKLPSVTISDREM